MRCLIQNLHSRGGRTLLGLLVVLFGPWWSLYGATRTVGTGGAYSTIQAAINAAVAGDVISIVEAKTYNEKLTLVNNGTNASRITLQNDSGGNVTVSNTSSPVVDLAGKDYWTFTGPMTFKYTGSGTGPRVFSNTHSFAIDSFRMTNVTGIIDGGSADGCVLYLADSDSSTITGCTFQVTSGAAASHDGSDILFASNLTFTNNTIQGVGTNNMQDGLVATGTNLTISGNTISNGQAFAGHPDGIVIQGDGNRSGGLTAGVVISGNFISDFDQCIYLDPIHADISGILVYNNLIRQTSGWTVTANINGIILDGDGDGTHKIEAGIYNNTVDVRGIWFRSTRQSSVATLNQKTVKNNLVVKNSYTGLYLDLIANVTLDNNCYDSAGDATICNWGGAAKTLAQVQAVAQEAKGIRVAPNLTSYRPNTGSPIIGKGTSLAAIFTTDITGSTRSSWDIGAYMYSAGPVATVTPASRDFGTVAPGSTADLTFTVQNTGTGTLAGAATVPAPFSVTTGGTYSLGAGLSQNVTVRYAPTAPGTDNQVVTFTGGQGVTRPVTGSSVIAPAITVTPATRSFGTIPVGSVLDLSFTVQNSGGGTLVGAASVATPFSILSGASYSLTAGQTQTVVVRYSPTAAGNHSGNVTFTGATGATRSVSGSASTVQAGLSVPVSSATLTAPFVLAGNYASQSTQTGLAGSGRLSCMFNVVDPGEYGIVATVDAPSDGENSLFLNIDAEPQDPFMVWDIPITSGLEPRLVSWRGNGTFDANQIAQKVFTLSAGQHELIIRGREANTKISLLQLVKRPARPLQLRLN